MILNMPFNDNGIPKPLLIVGENGSGKSLLLSNVVDSFYEIAHIAYQNALKQDDDFTNRQLFKTISSSQIMIGEQYLCAYIEYDHDSTPYEYLFKSGNKSFTEFRTEKGLSINDALNWGEDIGNAKKVTIPKKVTEMIFRKEVICYFPPDRYTKPSWMGKKYHDHLEFEQLQLRESSTGVLYNSITISNILDDHLKWLLDVIVDSRPDVVSHSDGSFSLGDVNQKNLKLLGQARINIESIMSIILGRNVEFSLDYRNNKGSRFRIVDKTNRQVIVPSLDALSTGQLALFNLFSTIIRYADNNDITKGISIGDINGIVAIDEVELHLHSKLQRDVLPKLIKRFPNVQFIVTSHSPLFVLGMQQAFGDEGFEIYQMPNGEKINPEMFSEFQTAYDYFIQTQKHQADIVTEVRKRIGSPLVITEGCTDWIHMKRAFEILQKEDQYSWIGELIFDFLEYYPENHPDGDLKLNMSGESLLTLCENYAKLPNEKPIIFIADNDVVNIVTKMKSNGTKKFKEWGNNVFSFTLPVPKNRIDTPSICIEHLFSDAEIIKEIGAPPNNKRLFMANEFDKYGRGTQTNNYFCTNRNKCKNGGIHILDLDKDTEVLYKHDNNDVNCLISKYKFATEVVADDFDFTNFVPIFEYIKEILHP